MKKIVLGILAHVDAGKTTLTESVLYLSKAIRNLGRVDHGDAFLDYNVQEIGELRYFQNKQYLIGMIVK